MPRETISSFLPIANGRFAAIIIANQRLRRVIPRFASQHTRFPSRRSDTVLHIIYTCLLREHLGSLGTRSTILSPPSDDYDTDFTLSFAPRTRNVSRRSHQVTVEILTLSLFFSGLFPFVAPNTIKFRYTTNSISSSTKRIVARNFLAIHAIGKSVNHAENTLRSTAVYRFSDTNKRRARDFSLLLSVPVRALRASFQAVQQRHRGVLSFDSGRRLIRRRVVNSTSDDGGVHFGEFRT